MYHLHRLSQRIHRSTRPYITLCDILFFNVINCWYLTQPKSWKNTSFQFCITVYSDCSPYGDAVFSVCNLSIWYVMGTQPYVYLLLIVLCIVILLLVIHAFYMEDISFTVVGVPFPPIIFQTCWIIELCVVTLTYWWHFLNGLLCTTPFPPICNIYKVRLSLKLIFIYFTWIVL